MTEKKGSILSPMGILLNKQNDENILFFKNIYCTPEHKKFEIFFVNIITKKVISKKLFLLIKQMSLILIMI